VAHELNDYDNGERAEIAPRDRLLASWGNPIAAEAKRVTLPQGINAFGKARAYGFPKSYENFSQTGNQSKSRLNRSWWPRRCRPFQTLKCSFGVIQSRFGITSFGHVNCLHEVGDALLGTGIGLLIFSGLGAGQRGLGLMGEEIGMPHLALFNGLLRVPDSLGEMTFRSQ
jgi:hypothetical protein